MSFKKLSFLVLSQIITLFVFCFIGYKFIKEGRSFAGIFVCVAFYFIYSFYFLINEIKIVIKDKRDGISEDILIFCRYTVLYKGIERNNNMPPIPIATFKKNDDYISLSGDYSNVNLKEGRKYKVKYYKNSEILVSISSVTK
jgi:hypothetical protein